MTELKAESMLVELMRYNNWANQTVLAACEGLDEALLARPIAGAYGSIRDTLAHIVRAESWYVSLLTGKRPPAPFDWKDGPGVAEIKAFALEVGEALMDAVQRVAPDMPVVEVDGEETWRYPATVVYIQIINHGIEHRTNITTILNQEGLNPPHVAGWGYMEAHQARFEAEADVNG